MTHISLLSLILTLRPLQPLTDVPPLGRAAHALLLDAVRWADPALAETLHAGSELHPFTASDVIGVSRKIGLRPDRTYPLCLTALTAPVARALLKAVRLTPLTASGAQAAPDSFSRDETTVAGEGAAPLRVGAEVELGNARFHVEAIDAGQDQAHQDAPQSDLSHRKSEIHHPWAV